MAGGSPDPKEDVYDPPFIPSMEKLRHLVYTALAIVGNLLI